MLGLLVLYFIGRAYYDLAVTYDKKKWLFAIVGIITYYSGMFLGMVLLAVIDIISGLDYIEELDETLLALIAFPFGLLFCWWFYRFLKNKWSNVKTEDISDILDSDILDNDFLEK